MYMKYTMRCILSADLSYTFSIHLMYTFCSTIWNNKHYTNSIPRQNSIYLKYTHLLAEYSAKSILLVYISRKSIFNFPSCCWFLEVYFLYTSRRVLLKAGQQPSGPRPTAPHGPPRPGGPRPAARDGPVAQS